MREARVLLASETYGESVLCISDCDNKELQLICERVAANNEDGIGKTWKEVAHEIVPDCLFEQLCSSDGGNELEVNTSFLNELDTVCVANQEYLTFSVVKSKV